MELKNLKDNFKFYSIIAMLTISSAAFLSAAQESKAPPYPRVEALSGAVIINGEDTQKLRKNFRTPIRDKGYFELGAGGELTVAIDAKRTLKVRQNSKVILPVINWETGQVPVVLLEKGEIEWSQAAGAGYNIALRSGLFEFIVPEGDFVFTFDPQKAWAGVKVLSGQLLFSGLNSEDDMLIKAGFQGGFQGKIEGDQLAYDVLLQGKKIAKGVLTPITALSAEEMAAPAKAKAEKAKKVKAAAGKKAQEQKKAKDAGSICKSPWGKFNECSYTCDNNPKGAKDCEIAKGASCVRHRCNANGVWADKLVLDPQTNQTTCNAVIRVGECQN